MLVPDGTVGGSRVSTGSGAGRGRWSAKFMLVQVLKMITVEHP